jgi:hypothetical protein
MPNFTVIVLKNSIAYLEWPHPWKTGNSLKEFRIEICPISTNLQKFHEVGDTWCTNITFAVTSYAAYYSKQLYLFPSTQYIIGIQAITYAWKFSKTVYVTSETPSTLKFDGHLNYKFNDTMVLLNIPRVVNNTKNSMIHVIIKRHPKDEICIGNACENMQIFEDLRVQTNINDDVWQVAELPVCIILMCV